VAFRGNSSAGVVLAKKKGAAWRGEIARGSE
jgi:hypothetical protein